MFVRGLAPDGPRTRLADWFGLLDIELFRLEVQGLKLVLQKQLAHDPSSPLRQRWQGLLTILQHSGFIISVSLAE